MTTTVNASFGDWAEMWLKYQCIGLTTDYQRAIKSQVRYLVEYLGDKPVTEVRPFDIERIISDLGIHNPHTKKPTAKKTLRDLRNTARNIFDYISDNTELIIKNPARKIRIPKNAPQGKRRALTTQEIQWVIHTDHRCRLAALIMTFCGLRAGELIPLNWTDIDFDKSVVNIYKSVTKADGNTYKIKTGTKNGKSRTVTIPKEVLDEIKTCRMASSSPYISSQLDGSMHTPTSWASMWESYNNTLSHLYASQKQAEQSIYDPKGIQKRIDRITPHIFRHTFATMLYTSGVDVLSAQKLLGHSHVTTTLEIYTHLDEMKYNISVEDYSKYVQNLWF